MVANSVSAAAGESSLEQQALKFIDEAEADRSNQQTWQEAVYRFCMPWRRRPGNTQQTHDQDDLFDSTAIEALQDFSADMQLTLTPTDDDWLTVGPAKNLGAADLAMIKKPLQDYQDAVFEEIRRSNFHEATQESYPDLGLGTCAMCIQDFDASAPAQCQAIPITDLLIVRGVYGGVDFRAREIPAMKLRDLRPTYPRAVFPPDIENRAAADPGDTVCVHECFWRLWGAEKETWQYVLLIERRQVDDAVLSGAGSCPIIAARWRTDSTTAWGIGPLYVVLPTIQTLDQLNYLVLKQLSFAVDPPGVYDDDGVINLEDGIEPGTWIPRQAGSRLEPLSNEGDFDTTFFERQQMQSDIKRALFQDKPEQSGDTPPTAQQWMDQKAEVARRMGAPIGRLSTEWQQAVFQRFAYLKQRRGELPEVQLDGKAVRVRTQSPLVKGQQQQKVAIANQILQMINQSFGSQQAALLVDSAKTLENIHDAIGDEMVVLRDDAAIAALVQSVATQASAAGMIPGQQPQPPAPPAPAPAAPSAMPPSPMAMQ